MSSPEVAANAAKLPTQVTDQQCAASAAKPGPPYEQLEGDATAAPLTAAWVCRAHLVLLRAHVLLAQEGPLWLCAESLSPQTQQDHPLAGVPAAMAFYSALGLGAERRSGLFWLDSTTALVAAGGAALLLDVPTGRQTLLDASGGLVTRAVAVHPSRGFVALAGAMIALPVSLTSAMHAHGA